MHNSQKTVIFTKKGHLSLKAKLDKLYTLSRGDEFHGTSQIIALKRAGVHEQTLCQLPGRNKEPYDHTEGGEGQELYTRRGTL